MYTIQALWTAAHHRIGAKFVILNNGAYQLLKLNIKQYWKDQGLPENDFPDSFDLRDPDIRFDQLAEAMGVGAVRVETAGPGRSGPRRGLRRRPARSSSISSSATRSSTTSPPRSTLGRPVVARHAETVPRHSFTPGSTRRPAE